MKPYKLLLLLALSYCLPGCGQPGPLYLPSQPTQVHVEPEQKQDVKQNTKAEKTK